MTITNCSSESASSGQRPIFLLCCVRSGSTLLRSVFDAHPDVWAPPELYLGSFCSACHHAAYWSDPHGDQTEARDASAIEYVRHTVGSFMAANTAARGKKIWCEKSPRNWNDLPLLEKVFPEARFVWLSRNCLDVIHSCLEIVWMRDSVLPELASHVARDPERLPAALLRYWVDTNRKFLDCEERTGDRCHRVRYEDIVLRPSETLGTLFANLGLPWSDDLLTALFDREHQPLWKYGPGDYKLRFTRHIHARSVGKGSRFHRYQFPQDLLNEADDLSQKLGYPSVGEGSFPADSVNKDATVGIPDDFLTGVMPALLARGSAKGMRGQLVVEVGRQRWLADLGVGEWRMMSHMIEADAMILVELKELAAIVRGDVNAADLLAEGKLIIKGELETAEDFFSLLIDGVSMASNPHGGESHCAIDSGSTASSVPDSHQPFTGSGS